MPLMVVATTNAPEKLRGLLSVWLVEVDVGVYAGVNDAKTRGMIWKNVMEQIRDGSAVMIWERTKKSKLFGFCSVGEEKRILGEVDGIVTSKRFVGVFAPK